MVIIAITPAGPAVTDIGCECSFTAIHSCTIAIGITAETACHRARTTGTRFAGIGKVTDHTAGAAMIEHIKLLLTAVHTVAIAVAPERVTNRHTGTTCANRRAMVVAAREITTTAI